MIDKTRLALGVRQPWAELIVRGIKTIEVRRTEAQVRGPIYVYASLNVSDHPAAELAAASHQLDLASLPRGLIVGSTEIVSTGPLDASDAAASCLRAEDLAQRGLIGWRLQGSTRLEEPLAVRFRPYGIWFYPFQPRGGRG